MYGYVKVGAAVPRLRLADCIYNKEQIIKLAKEAGAKGVRVLTFPELCITGYTCADLFMQRPLLTASEKTVKDIAEEIKEIDMFLTIGVPVEVDSQQFNCAIAIYKGQILGIIPKTYTCRFFGNWYFWWFGFYTGLAGMRKSLRLSGNGSQPCLGRDYAGFRYNRQNLSKCTDTDEIFRYYNEGNFYL